MLISERAMRRSLSLRQSKESRARASLQGERASAPRKGQQSARLGQRAARFSRHQSEDSVSRALLHRRAREERRAVDEKGQHCFAVAL